MSNNLPQTYLRHYIESKIQTALSKEELANLRLWLNIAADTRQSRLNISFLNQQNLSQYAIEQSNSLLRQYREYPRQSPWYHRVQVFFRLKTT